MAATAHWRRRTRIIIRTQTDASGLMDHGLILVSEDAYRQFLARLDAPPKPNARLRKSLGTPARWDKT